MKVDAVLEANKNLNKRIEKLEEENKELFWFKEKYINLQKSFEEVKRQLDIKRTHVRVVQKKENINYVLQITRVEDTPEGMFIEVL